MPKAKDEIIREIGDAYDYGDYGDAARLEELEGELAHIERLEGIAERMRQAGYADWEVAEEVAEADASWRGVRDNTEAHRTTGAFIPTTPRILAEERAIKPDPSQEAPQAAEAMQVPPVCLDAEGVARPTMQASALLDAYLATGTASLPEGIRANWEWMGDEKRLCLGLRSGDVSLQASWPEGKWSGDAIDADGWHDLDPEEASAYADDRGLNELRAFVFEALGDPEALVAAPADREAMAARMATVYDDGVVMLPREVSESKLLEDYQEASPGRLPKDLTAAWEQEEDGRFCLALRFQERRGPLDLVSPKTVRLCASLADGSWSGCVESPYGWGGKGIAPERAAEMAERIGLEGFRAFAFDALESFAFSQLVAAPADREATAFEAMLGDASAQAARENAPLAQQAPQAAERTR